MAERWPPPRGITHGFPEPDGATSKVEKPGDPARLFANRSFGYGEAVLREVPLLRVPADDAAATSFVQSTGTKAMQEVGRRIGDYFRLALFAGFKLLKEEQQQEFQAMGGGKHIAAKTKEAIGHFLKDFPEFETALDWNLFADVVGIALDRGNKIASGDFVVYRLCSIAAHSFTPNAVVETRGDKGEKELRVIAFSGIAANEEICVSYLPEDRLLLPPAEQLQALTVARAGQVAEGVEAGKVDSVACAKTLQKVRKVPKESSSETLEQLIRELSEVDKAMPFALVTRARARANLARACETSGDPDLMKLAAHIYDAAFDEVEVVLGPEKAHKQLENLRRLRNQLQGLAE